MCLLTLLKVCFELARTNLLNRTLLVLTMLALCLELVLDINPCLDYFFGRTLGRPTIPGRAFSLKVET